MSLAASGVPREPQSVARPLMNSPRRLTTIHGQVSRRPVSSVPDARFRVAPHLYSTASVEEHIGCFPMQPDVALDLVVTITSLY
jgi:hypothetical protein